MHNDGRGQYDDEEDGINVKRMIKTDPGVGGREVKSWEGRLPIS